MLGQKATIIKKAISELEKGKEIDEDTLPQPVTADYICGCSQKERINEFMTIIKEYVQKKKDMIEKMNKTIEKHKLLDKKTLMKKKR